MHIEPLLANSLLGLENVYEQVCEHTSIRKAQKMTANCKIDMIPHISCVCRL